MTPTAWPARAGRFGLLCVLLAAVAHGGEPQIPLPGTPGIFGGAPTAGFPEVGAVGVRRQDGQLAVCSGTLVAPTVVLTAAHCLRDARAAGVVFFPTGDFETRLEMRVRNVAVHPAYGGRPFADLGLLFLSSPAGAILPAALADRRPGRSRGDIVGFGDNGAGVSLVKQVGAVRLDRRCPRRAIPQVRFRRGELKGSLCWRPGRGGSDICSGDSGGPLYVGGRLAGVHSGGLSRTPDGCPGVLAWSTDVTRFRDWIDSEIAQEVAR